MNSQNKQTTRVYAVAFRHRMPGEGVGGCEWDVQPGAALDRIRDAVRDPNYEISSREFDVVDLRLDDYSRSLITDAIDQHFWEDFHGKYTEPVLIERTGQMKFTIDVNLNDGYANAPPVDVEVDSIEELFDEMRALDTFTNDYGVPLPVGAVVTVSRKA